MQYIFLDFDGALTDYNGELLQIPEVVVEDSGLSGKRINKILTALNEMYADAGIIFTTERPSDTEYSTIYIGRTDAFSAYGDYIGLAETIDGGNIRRDDNAFVMLDLTSSNDRIIDTIAHEVDHIVSGMRHAGEKTLSLDSFAAKAPPFFDSSYFEQSPYDYTRKDGDSYIYEVSTYRSTHTYTVHDKTTYYDLSLSSLLTRGALKHTGKNSTGVSYAHFKFGEVTYDTTYYNGRHDATYDCIVDYVVKIPAARSGDIYYYAQPTISELMYLAGYTTYSELYGKEHILTTFLYNVPSGNSAWSTTAFSLSSCGVLLMQEDDIATEPDHTLTDFRTLDSTVISAAPVMGHVIVGTEGHGNLLVSTPGESGDTPLYNSAYVKNVLVTKGGRAEINFGSIADTVVEYGGFLLLTNSDSDEVVFSRNITVNNYGTFYSAGIGTYAIGTTVTAGGEFYAGTGTTVSGLAVAEYGYAVMGANSYLTGTTMVSGNLVFSGSCTTGNTSIIADLSELDAMTPEKDNFAPLISNIQNISFRTEDGEDEEPETTAFLYINVRGDQAVGDYYIASAQDVGDTDATVFLTSHIDSILFAVDGLLTTGQSNTPNMFTWSDENNYYSGIHYDRRNYVLGTTSIIESETEKELYDLLFLNISENDALELGRSNNEIATANSITGSVNVNELLTSKTDADYFKLAETGKNGGTIRIYGSELNGINANVSLVREDGTVIKNLSWNDTLKNYSADYTTANGAVYLKVIGTTENSIKYNLTDLADQAESFETFQLSIQAAVGAKETKTVAVFRAQPGIYSINGPFPGTMNAKLQFTDLNTGKTAGTVVVKNGQVVSGNNLLLSGDYSVTVTGSNTAFNGTIGLTGYYDKTVNNADDTIGLVRFYGNSAYSYKADSVGFGDETDLIKAGIVTSGKYSFNLSGISPDAIVTLDIYSSVNGGALKKVRSATAKGSDIVLKDLLLTCDGNTEYFVSVTCKNAAKGIFTDYQLSIYGDEYYSEDKGYANNVLETASFLNLNDRIVGDSIKKTISVDGWVGYGDTMDYYTFSVADAANFDLTMEALPASATISIFRVVEDTVSGKYTQYKIKSVKADKTAGLAEISAFLQRGDYAISVECADKKTDKFNTDYTFSLTEASRPETIVLTNHDRTEVDFKKDEIKSLSLSSHTTLSFDKTAYMSLWMDNGKNGKQKLTPAYDSTDKTYKITLAAGEYYLSFSKQMYDLVITSEPARGYSMDEVSDNNTFATATTINGTGYISNWIGFGDGADYYRFVIDPTDKDCELTPGSYSVTLSDAVKGNAKMTVYRQEVSTAGTVTYKKIKTCTSAGLNTDKSTITLNELVDGTYYIAVESTNSKTAKTAKDTNYTVTLRQTDSMPQLDSTECVLDKNEYAYYVVKGNADQIFEIQFESRLENSYDIRLNDGKGGTKTTEYNKSGDGLTGTILVTGGTSLYIKNTKVNKFYDNAISVKSQTEVVNTEVVKIGIYPTDEENRQYFTDYNNPTSDLNGWIGYGDVADEYFFSTGSSALSSGWAEVTLTDLTKTFDDNTTMKCAVSVSKQENGTWKTVKKITTSLVYNKKTGKYELKNNTLGVALENNTSYKLTVEALGATTGKNAASYKLEASVDVFDLDNNTFAGASELTGNTEATVVKGYDSVDVYDVSACEQFALEMTDGSAKVTFYNEDFEVVAPEGAALVDNQDNVKKYLTNQKNTVLTADSATGDGIMIASAEWAELGISFVKVEANGKNNNHYQITIA